MCLLQTATSIALRTVLLNTPGLIEDIYKSNADGIGIMYATADGLKVRKALPKNPAEARKFIEKMPTDDRQVALHWRWRTHGDINLEQCHPYAIAEGVAMMHNGILHTGNKADVSKSDTWHFIEDYLKTLSIDALHDSKLCDMVGEFIGQNKFAIMSGDGRLTVINKDQGVEYNGVWYSNTYAWSPELVDPTYKKRSAYAGYTTATRAYGRAITDDWADDDMEYYPGRAAALIAGEIEDEDDGPEINAAALDQALEDLDVELLTEYFEEVPMQTLNYLFQAYRFTPYARTPDKDLSITHRNIRHEILVGGKDRLFDRMERDITGSSCEQISEVFNWYVDAAPREPSAEVVRVAELHS